MAARGEASSRERFRLPAGAALALLLALVMFTAAAPARAAFPGANGRIAFSKAPAETIWHEIYTVNPDGSDLKRLTNNTSQDENPAWSPDGRKIAFVSKRDQPDPNCDDPNNVSGGCSAIYVMNADGSNPQRLTSPTTAYSDPTWSPDGQKIAYSKRQGGGGTATLMELFVMNADGSGETQLTNFSSYGPSWSPDGRRIAFSTVEVAVINADGTGLTGLTPSDDGYFGFSPNWSPDGRLIAFAGCPEVTDCDPVYVFTMNADGTGITNLTSNDPNFSESPAWSPDGQRIVFSKSGDIYTMDPDGTDLTPVATRTDPNRALHPDWQPILYGYARPKWAGHAQLRLVPAYEKCAASNATHGPPLVASSCSPASQASDFLTIGTPDANQNPASSEGKAVLTTICNPPAPGGVPPCSDPGDQADVALEVSMSDVRQKPTLLDYGGTLLASVSLRITDRWNGLCVGCPSPGTVTDLPLSFSVPCTATVGNGGSDCDVSTTVEALIAGAVPEGRRSVWELGQFQLFDGGSDGNAETTGDNTLFAVQGLFAP